jgi:hypothetical protein
VEGDVGVTLPYYCHSHLSMYDELCNISPRSCFVFLSTHPLVAKVTSDMMPLNIKHKECISEHFSSSFFFKYKIKHGMQYV